MPPQFIFTMRGLSRFHPPDRQVLDNINISMYPGAKIGVIGSNGAGKARAAARRGVKPPKRPVRPSRS